MTEIRYKIVYIGLDAKDPPDPPGYVEVLLSLWVEDLACVTYIPGQFMEAPRWLACQGYHLLVFNSEEEANQYRSPATIINYSSTLQLWECECEDEITPLPIILDAGDLRRGVLIPSISQAGWPQGTRMYKRVKLTRRLK